MATGDAIASDRNYKGDAVLQVWCDDDCLPSSPYSPPPPYSPREGYAYSPRLGGGFMRPSRSRRFYDLGSDGREHFLRSCHLCKRPLGLGDDIFMYRLVFLFLSCFFLPSLEGGRMEGFLGSCGSVFGWPLGGQKLWRAKIDRLRIGSADGNPRPSVIPTEIMCSTTKSSRLISMADFNGRRDTAARFSSRGDTPFCSEGCRQEQIDRDEADEKMWSSVKAMQKGKASAVADHQRRETSPSRSDDLRVRTGTVAAG
ncbi:hypothetical protein EJ110_NYTH34093 [Nymphaea thermarum]|nr:hypothetical protein EJ110_NYTH34093 [Nymphaea thermarum]